jgi:CRP-like cAMP-binding protein
MRIKEIKKEEYLYQKGDDSLYFYFILRGKLEVISESGGVLKFSRNVDEGEFFGKSITFETRNDYAKCPMECCEILEIPKDKYESIVK